MICSHTLCLLPLKIPLPNSLRTKNSIVDKNPKFCPLKQLDLENEHGIRIDKNKERSDCNPYIALRNLIFVFNPNNGIRMQQENHKIQ